MRRPGCSPTRMAYADETKLHAALTHLRANAPVSWVEVPELPAVLGDHQSTPTSWTIERANTLFTNSPRPVLMTAEADELQAGVGDQHADPHGRPAASGGAGDRC